MGARLESVFPAGPGVSGLYRRYALRMTLGRALIFFEFFMDFWKLCGIMKKIHLFERMVPFVTFRQHPLGEILW